jgi:serine/threonine-protein kinase
MSSIILPPNHILNRRYIISDLIGQGGFGITYRAFDTRKNIYRCIKELFVSGSSTRQNDYSVHSLPIMGFSFGDLVIRFIEEAENLSKFNHPNIVDVRGVFQENGTAYMVLEYLEGVTVASYLKKHRKMPVPMAIEITLQILKALSLVHDFQMLHRDIKPDNIILTPDSRAVLIDFGSSRLFDYENNENHTAILSPGYAPLEQYSENSPKHPCTDIYAIGATLYHMLTGYRPASSPDRTQNRLPMPHEICSDVDTVLSSIVMLCMELNMEERMQSAEELMDILQTYKYNVNK